MNPEQLTVSARNHRTLAFFSLVILLLAGCASSRVPPAIGKAPENPISVAQVQQEPTRFLGQRVRWGGTIIEVGNHERTTEIELLARPLDADGEPRKKSGEGRFIALLTGFADPAEYPEQRSLTITGRLERVETRPIGEYPYSYPVVSVEQSHLWPEPPPDRWPYSYPGPWHHPWHYPYYPWHPWHPWHW